MNTFDLIVGLVLIVAVWNGARKGFVVQVCSLAGLVAAVWLAARFGVQAGTWLRLDESIAAPGGFVAVLVVVVLAVAVAGRLLRKLFRFAGFGLLDAVLGIAVSVLKYMLLTGVLFTAFDALNADYSLVKRQTVERSHCYGPVVRLSDALFPFLEWVGDRVPGRDKPDGAKPDGAEFDGAEFDGTKPDGTKPDGADAERAEPAAEPERTVKIC